MLCTSSHLQYKALAQCVPRYKRLTPPASDSQPSGLGQRLVTFNQLFHAMSELSPQAQAVLDAYRSSHLSINNLAAALRAAADQVVPKEWPTIEDYNEYEQGVAAAHIKHRNQILAIADELEAQ